MAIGSGFNTLSEGNLILRAPRFLEYSRSGGRQVAVALVVVGSCLLSD